MTDLTLDPGLPPVITPPNPNPIMAFDPERTNNAQLMVDCHTLGYLTDNMRIFDATYGKGAFWNDWKPRNLQTNDINPNTDAWLNFDFTDLPFLDEQFNAVIFDPPYKLNGTPSGPMDDRYGVGIPRTVTERLELILDGTDECGRVSSNVLLIKLQDQVVSGNVRWMTRRVTEHIEREGWGDFKLVDELYVHSYRPQPAGTRQLHARRNYSTLLVFKRK